MQEIDMPDITTPTISATIAEGGSLTVTITLHQRLARQPLCAGDCAKDKTPISAVIFVAAARKLTPAQPGQTLTLTPTTIRL